MTTTTAVTSLVCAHLVGTLTVGRVALVLALLTLASFLVDFTWKPRYSSSLPRVGNGDGLLGTIQNWIFYIVHHHHWVDEGYHKVRLSSLSLSQTLVLF